MKPQQEIDLDEVKDLIAFRREIWMMSGLSHQNILRLIGFCPSPPCIVSEFAPHGRHFSYHLILT